MTKDKRLVIAFAIVYTAILTTVLFIPQEGNRIIAAILLPLAALLTHTFIKKRAIHSIFSRQVLMIVGVSALLYVMLYYLTGFAFGFARSMQTGLSTVWEYIIPISTIIVSTEIIRNIFVAQNVRCGTVLIFAASVLADVIALGDTGRIFSFNLFMDLFGLVIFPSVTGNILYHFISKRYGMYPNIAYRLITVMYLYVFRYVPAAPAAILAFIRLFFPLIIYAFIDLLYTKKTRYAKKKKSRLRFVPGAAVIAFMICVVMLISCEFKYGTLVIATESMTGEIDKGDAIIYERYDGEQIELGDIIVFEKDGRRTVHRVVDIKKINSQYRYYTKGDANEDMDTGYVTASDIIGICHFKLPYIGYPTIWMRDTLKFNQP